MTISEKETELGYSLGDLILSGSTFKKEVCPNNGFQCFKLEAPIPVDGNQRGSTQNFYYYKSDGLLETATLSEVTADYKTWLGAQPYTEKPSVHTDEEAF